MVSDVTAIECRNGFRVGDLPFATVVLTRRRFPVPQRLRSAGAELARFSPWAIPPPPVRHHARYLLNYTKVTHLEVSAGYAGSAPMGPINVGGWFDPTWRATRDGRPPPHPFSDSWDALEDFPDLVAALVAARINQRFYTEWRTLSRYPPFLSAVGGWANLALLLPPVVATVFCRG